MVTLADLADYAEVFGFAVVAVALVFALIQVRDARAERRDRATVEALRVWQTPEVIAAHDRVWSITTDEEGQAPARLSGADQEAAHVLAHVAEVLGVMVFHRVASFHVVQDMMGAALVLDWKRLAPWVVAQREQQRRETVYEWFQWLAERLEETRPAYKVQGAHAAFRAWRP